MNGYLTPLSAKAESDQETTTRARLLMLPLFGAVLLPSVSIIGLTLDNIFVLLFIFLYLANLSRRGGLLFGPGARWLAGLALLAVASALYQGVPSAAHAGLRFLSYALFVDGLLSLKASDARRMIKAVIAVTSVAATSVMAHAFGIYEFGTLLLDREGDVLRGGGLVGHPNFAAYSVGLGTLAIVFGDDSMRWRHRAPLLVLHVSAIASTAARTAFIALVVAVLLGAIADLRRLILSALALATFSFSIGERILRRFEYVGLSGGLQGQNAAGWRLDHWREVWSLSSPVSPFGIGWNETQNLTREALAAHNGYLQVLIELGSPALLCLGGFLIFLFRTAPIDALRRAVLIFILIIGTGDPGILYPAVFYGAVALLLGPAMGVRHHVRPALRPGTG